MKTETGSSCISIGGAVSDTRMDVLLGFGNDGSYSFLDLGFAAPLVSGEFSGKCVRL